MKLKQIETKSWVCLLDGWHTSDITNKSGSITVHFKELGRTSENYREHFVEDVKVEPKWVCEKTGSMFSMTGFSMCINHIKNKLNRTVHDYVEEYPEMADYLEPGIRQERHKLVLSGELNQENTILSPLDGRRYHRLGCSHLRKYGYKSVKDFLKDYPGQPLCSAQSSKKASASHRGAHYNKSSTVLSIIEVEIINTLIQQKKNFIIQHQVENKRFDFHFPDENITLELENSFHHPEKLTYLSFTEIKGYANDVEKWAIAKRNNMDVRFLNVDDIKDVAVYTPEVLFERSVSTEREIFQLGADDVILAKEYLVEFKQEGGEQKLRNEMTTLTRFIRQQMPVFTPQKKYESLFESLKALKEYNYTTTMEDGNFIYNRMPKTGSNYLKNNFLSYWKASNKGIMNVYDSWADDVVFENNLAYRCGLNKSGETFNITINELVRGLSFQKHTVSWFKPGMAASVYRKYIDPTNETPIVVDPCAGFGARMMAFYALYPKGLYVGIEPNPETYNELILLSQSIQQVASITPPVLINAYFEDCVDSGELPNNPDLIFTSIPYWDTEIYSHDFRPKYHDSYQIWKNNFLTPLERYCEKGDQSIINMSDIIYKDRYGKDRDSCLLVKKRSPLSSNSNELSFERLVDMKSR
jgi:hypothetical protein